MAKPGMRGIDLVSFDFLFRPAFISLAANFRHWPEIYEIYSFAFRFYSKDHIFLR